MTSNMGYHVGSPRFGQMYPCNGDAESEEVSTSGIPNFWAVTMGECEKLQPKEGALSPGW